ncbi:hypothetical protein Sgly_0870 [Syntrophobotulus glycolicus DSM 8271]|uniref:Uncharacterized protein n=1 Tax=Syntrophobotulus glycolicus (strain DSM 8271 / FlGlyR) TaxID=645991 RepID=F0T1V4_SYNGF|nr:hypothetical protein Sgly_0870 [Syntrophobotulus glycolicus DSM 8271]
MILQRRIQDLAGMKPKGDSDVIGVIFSDLKRIFSVPLRY